MPSDDLPRGLYVDCGIVISTVSLNPVTGPELYMAASSNAPTVRASRSTPIASPASATRHNEPTCLSNKSRRKSYHELPHHHQPIPFFGTVDRSF